MRESLRLVLSNPALRRVQLAFLGSGMGSWALSTAVVVWAFELGGVGAVGAYSAVRLVSVGVAAPLGAVVADRVSRRAFMLASDATSMLLVAATALGMGLGAPAGVVLLLAVLAGVVGAPFRAAQAGLLPCLVTSPEELTASNAVAANTENLVGFAGPALGGLLVALVDVEAAVWFDVAMFAWSLVLVGGVRVPATPPEPAEPPGAPRPGLLHEVSAGVTTIIRDPDLRLVAGLAAAQGLVWGALTVFLVVIATTVLGADASGVGYLNAVLGVGALAGGLVVLTRTARGRLAGDMVLGLAGWSLPLLLLALAPSPVTAVAALLAIGLMDPWLNLGLDTIPQRLVEDRVLSRVFAALDSALVLAVAAGAAVAPAMVRLLGLESSLAAVGAVGAAYALGSWRSARALDGRLHAPAHLGLLRSVPLFAPLPAPVVEHVLGRCTRVRLPAGALVVREGEVADRFFVVVSGEVVVTRAGVALRTGAAGEFFGEVGLLRGVRRTATVVATTDVDLLALPREDFLDALTGASEARAAAEDVAARRTRA